MANENAKAVEALFDRGEDYLLNEAVEYMQEEDEP